MQEEGRATHPEQERPRLQEIVNSGAVSGKTSRRFSHSSLESEFSLTLSLSSTQAVLASLPWALGSGLCLEFHHAHLEMLPVSSPESGFLKGLFPHVPVT